MSILSLCKFNTIHLQRTYIIQFDVIYYFTPNILFRHNIPKTVFLENIQYYNRTSIYYCIKIMFKFIDIMLIKILKIDLFCCW